MAAVKKITSSYIYVENDNDMGARIDPWVHGPCRGHGPTGGSGPPFWRGVVQAPLKLRELPAGESTLSPPERTGERRWEERSSQGRSFVPSGGLRVDSQKMAAVKKSTSSYIYVENDNDMGAKIDPWVHGPCRGHGPTGGSGPPFWRGVVQAPLKLRELPAGESTLSPPCAPVDSGWTHRKWPPSKK